MEWHEINTAEDIEQLQKIYGNFEDSYLVRMEYVSGDHVDHELVGSMVQSNDLRAVFQRLDEDPFSIELWFTHTKRVNMFFVNPADRCLSDIYSAKVCMNSSSVFWTVYMDFDPYSEADISARDIMLIEAEGMRWRVLSEKAAEDEYSKRQ